MKYCRLHVTSNAVKMCVRAWNERNNFYLYANPWKTHFEATAKVCVKIKIIALLPRLHANFHGVRSDVQLTVPRYKTLCALRRGHISPARAVYAYAQNAQNITSRACAYACSK